MKTRATYGLKQGTRVVPCKVPPASTLLVDYKIIVMELYGPFYPLVEVDCSPLILVSMIPAEIQSLCEGG